MGMAPPVFVAGNSGPFAICTCPPRPQVPRWLVSKGREAEALGVLAYYHANSNE